MVAEAIVGHKELYVVATEAAFDVAKWKKDEIVENLVKKVIKTMMDAAVQEVAAFAQATTLPPMIAEVHAHEMSCCIGRLASMSFSYLSQGYE